MSNMIKSKARIFRTCFSIAFYLVIFLNGYKDAFAENYGNIWHFGNQAGIDFKGCEARIILNSSINGFEGCASICDTSGNLLFYTNSDVVWNKSNNVMANGNLISSSGTISQVLIVPQPGSLTTFYIITSKIQAAGTLSLRYHVVDMTRNSGAGEVVSSNNVITTWNVTEQIAATTHANGTDIWIMTHEYGTDKFLAYLLTSSGIGLTPVVSTVGPAHIPCTSNINSRGEIKFSPDGNRVAFNGNGVGNNSLTNILAVFDFDNATGMVSNAINLPYSNGEFGLSFSPDNSKLYGSTWKAFAFGVGEYNYIYQFDLSSGVPSTIINSKIIIDSVQSNNIYGSMKLAPNGKIYIARMNSDSLGVINEPNLPGTLCNYVSNGLYLGGNTSTYGLNNYIEYKNYCSPTTDINSIHDESILTVFPNPVNDRFVLQSKKKFSNASVLIYNSLGEIVKVIKDISGNEILINDENLSPGIYFISIYDHAALLAKQKFVVVD